MRRLALSLVVVVAMATFAVGLVVDRLFDAAGGAADEPLDAWRAVGRELAARVLSDADETVDAATGGATGGGTSWSLTTRTALALDDETLAPEERAALREALESPLGLALESARGLRVFYALPDGEAVLAIDHPETRAEGGGLPLLLTLLFYVALLTLVLVWLLPLLRRLSRLGDAARAFGRGELDVRVATHRASDLHAVESAFNAMARRIERLIEDNRLLGSGVAHDLRTPLARLRFGIDVLAERDERGRGVDDRLSAHVGRLQGDIGAMERLLEAMLTYARFDGRHASLRRVPLDLATLLEARLDALDAEERARIAVVVTVACGRIEGDARTLGMLIDNLLGNALRHARFRVEVRLDDADGPLELRVEDDGPGVPRDARVRVFEPFARDLADGPDESGARSGYGLGLALIARIAERHDATVDMGDSAELGGARCRVRFERTWRIRSGRVAV